MRSISRGAKLTAFAALVGLPFLVPFGTLGTANLALTYGLVAFSLVILTGWVGQIGLAQAAFVGLGAYSAAIAVRSGWSYMLFPVSVLIAAAVAAGAAALLGVVALRVRGLYLAVATLVFAWMAQGYLFNLPWLGGQGGSSVAKTSPLGEPGSVPFVDFSDRRTFYFILLAVVGGAALGAANLRDSKTGRAWFAVKGSEVAAASLGIDVTRAKLVAFATSGFVAGLAGGLSMTHRSVATASEFTVERSLFFLAIAVVGGLISLGGALASGALFASLEELFFRVDALAGLLLVVSAGLLAGVLLFFPAGLAGIPPRLASLLKRARALVPRRPKAPSAKKALPAQEAPAPEPKPTTLGVIFGALGYLPRLLSRAWAASHLDRALKIVFSPLRRLGVFRLFTSRISPRRHPAPDVLHTALENAAEAEVLRLMSMQDTPATLSYRPGVATKVELAPRHERAEVLGAKGITVVFGGLTAVSSFDLEVRKGEIVGLIGPNGAGKTTLFNAISGLNQPTSGTVAIYGKDVTSVPVHRRAQVGVGRTFQVLQLFPQLTVFENLMVATHIRNPTGFFSHMAATRGAVASEANARSRVRRVIGLAGLDDVSERQVSDLPFGVLRLVELARALVTGAPFIMLDEPASGLDNTETDRFMDFLLWVRQALGVTMLLIEHDMRVAMGLADYLYVIDRGQKIAQGLPADVQKNEAVIAAYLGAAPTDDTDETKPEEPKTKAPAKTKPKTKPKTTATAPNPNGARTKPRPKAKAGR